MSRMTSRILLLALVVLWWGILVNVISADYTVFPDTSSYQASEGFPVSFTGDAWRAWPVPLLFSFVPDYRLQAVLQAGIYGFAWTVVVWVFLRHLSPKVAGITAGAVVALALTPLYLQWTLTILSESITLGLVLLGASCAELARRCLRGPSGFSARGWACLAGFIGLVGMAAMSRMTLITLLWAIGLVLTVVAIRRGKQVVAGALVGCLLGMSAYVLWLNGRIDEHWGMSRSATYYSYLTATGTMSQGVLADPLYAYIVSRGPACLAGIRASAGGVEGPDPWELRRELNTRCAEGVAWLEANFQNEYAKYAAVHPSYTARFLLDYLPASGDPGGYAVVVSILPSPVAAMYSSSDGPPHEYRPIYLWILGALAALALGIVSWLRKDGLWDDAVIPLALIGAGLISLLATVLTLNSEIARIASQASAALILGVILAFATRHGSLRKNTPRDSRA